MSDYYRVIVDGIFHESGSGNKCTEIEIASKFYQKHNKIYTVQVTRDSDEEVVWERRAKKWYCLKPEKKKKRTSG